jgi:hypothetical protein
MIDWKFFGSRLAAASERRPLPNDLILEVLFTENFIEHCFDIMPLLGVEMDVYASVVGENFAKHREASTKKLYELRAKNLVAVGLLLVLHEILPRGKGRVDINKFYLAACAEPIWPLLIG